jgi:hypothetical protein
MNLKQFDKKNYFLVGLLVLGFILINNALFLSSIAFKGFVVSDFGAFIDGGWRILKGQKTYADFYYSTGPIHLYLHAIFFFIFGFGKTAILAHLITLSSTVMCCTYIATFKRIPLVISLILTALTGMGFYWGYPHPWYDMAAHFWGILAVTACILTMPFKTNKTALWISLFCGIMATLSLLTKSNLGGTYGILFFLTFLFTDRRGWALMGYILGCIMIALLLSIFAFDPLLYLKQTVFDFGASRGQQIYRLLIVPAWMKNLYWIPVATMLVAMRRFPDEKQELKILFYGLSLIAILGLNVGSLRGGEHIPLMGTCLALALIILYQVKPLCQNLKAKIKNHIAIALMIGIALFHIYNTASFGIAIYNRYPEEKTIAPGNYPLKTGPFKGWLFPEDQGMVLDELVSFAKDHIAKEEEILILCDLHIGYALIQKESFKQLSWQFPVLPNPENLFSGYGKSGQYIQDNPPTWLLYRKIDNIEDEGSLIRDVRYLFNFLNIPENFLNQYSLEKNWGEYYLLKKITV